MDSNYKTYRTSAGRLVSLHDSDIKFIEGGPPQPLEGSVLDHLPVFKVQSAVLFLQRNIPSDQLEKLKDLREEHRESSDPWWAVNAWHFYGGMNVRNLLRTNGYGEDYFGIENLDDIYIDLLEYAIDGGPLDPTLSEQSGELLELLMETWIGRLIKWINIKVSK